jgi:hypothetical protein
VQHEAAVVESDPDVEMLESADSLEDGVWIRRSHCCPRKCNMEPRSIDWAATTPGVACDGVFCYFARLVTGLRPNALFVVGFAKMHVEMLTHR